MITIQFFNRRPTEQQSIIAVSFPVDTPFGPSQNNIVLPVPNSEVLTNDCAERELIRAAVLQRAVDKTIPIVFAGEVVT